MYRDIGFGPSDITDGDDSDGIVVAGGLKFQVYASGNWSLNFDNGRLNFSEDPTFGDEQFQIVVTNVSGGDFAYRDFTMSYAATDPETEGGWVSNLQFGSLLVPDTTSHGPGDETFSYQRDFNNTAPSVTTSSLTIMDTPPSGSSNNPTSSFWLDNFVVDTDLPLPNVPPVVTSIVRAGAVSGNVPASATSVSYTVTFSESVTGVDTTDFRLVTIGTATGTINSVTGSGSTYTVTVDALAGDGTLRLDVGSSGTGIVDADGAAIAGGYTAGQSFTLDRTPPALAISSDKSTLIAGQTATITFTFSEDPGATFTAADAVVSGGTLGAISGSGLTRTALFTPATNTNDGTASITVPAGSYADAVGNAGGAGTSPSLTFDTKAPSAPAVPDLAASADSGASSSDNITSVTTPTFTGAAGSAEAGATLRLYDTDGTTVLGSTTVNGDGSWQIASTALGEGAHTITAEAVDAAGNVGAPSSSLTVTIDTLAPAAPSAPNLVAASDSGRSNADNITNVVAPTFEGVSEAGATVTLYDTDGTTVLGTTEADGSGRWSVTSSTLSEGSHTVTVKATDVAGNTSAASSGLDVTIDASAPAAQVDTAALSADTGASTADFVTSQAAQTVSGTLSASLGAGEQVEVSLDNGATWIVATATVGGSAWSLPVTLAGANTLQVRVADTAGNVGTVFSKAYVLDTVAPAAPSAPDLDAGSDTGASDSDNVTSSDRPTFTGSAEAGSTVTLRDANGDMIGSGTAIGGTW
ncbi:Ig-like domain-containing protein, partial [Aureimonas sp. AU22]|uniref:Ig-like domain-containing protein n=1 Tax=Aureimonas sp. AU22 TaxID=1638162 RepID=UPI000A41DE03